MIPLCICYVTLFSVIKKHSTQLTQVPYKRILKQLYSFYCVMITEKKMSHVILCLCAFVTFLNFLPFTISSSKNCDLNKLLIKNEILEDLKIKLPDECLKTLQVQFPSGNSPFVPGSELDLASIRHQPMIMNLHELLAEGETLTVLMVDPDAPSRKYPKYRCVFMNHSFTCHHSKTIFLRSFLHWLVQFNGRSDVDSKTLVEFMPSSPPKATGKHRYTFLAFSQSSKEVTMKIPQQRPNFQVAPFVFSNHLGNLVGATFYFAQAE